MFAVEEIFNYDRLSNRLITIGSRSFSSLCTCTATTQNNNEYNYICGTAVSYDAGGNLVRDICHYDYENSLVEIRKTNDTITVTMFEYDAFGRRIKKEYVVKHKTVAKLMIGIIVIGGSIGYFMYQAMQSSWSYYYSVDEFAGANDTVKNSSLRLAGKVKVGTVSRDMGRMQLSFVLAGTNNELPVKYTGIVPDNFAEGIEVVVEGRLEPSGVFNSQMMMTRCESKYKAKVN